MSLRRELKAYRSRSRTRQEALAERLGISQAFVSRLENGQATPDEGLRDRIRAIIEDPTARPTLDYVFDSVRASPHMICLIRQDGDAIAYEALSAGFLEHPQFVGAGEGQRIHTAASDEGRVLIDKILSSGAFSGVIESIDAMWRTHVDEQHYFWRTIYTPIKSTRGVWYLHCAMTPMTEEVFDTLMTERGTPIIVTPYH